MCCSTAYEKQLWKRAAEQLLGTNLQRGFSSRSGQVDSTRTSSESPLSLFGCCSPQVQSVSKWWGQTSSWGCIVLPCWVVPVDTPSWCWFGQQLGLLHFLPSHSSSLISVGYPAVLCGEAPHGDQHSHPSGLRQVPGWWLWVSLFVM